MENPPEGENQYTNHSEPAHPAVPPDLVASSPPEPPAPAYSPVAPPAVPPNPPAAAPATSAPAPAAQSPVTADQSHNTHEGLHILQWLTFMFWGLTVLALAILTSSVLQRLIVGTDSSTFNYYVIASLVILLPLAFVCDVIYAKQEPEKKIGAASRIMAAYAIIFALFAILSLLGIAWNIVAWATGHGLDHSNSVADITSGLFILVYYLATFMRTLNPTHIGWLPKAYRFMVLGLVIVFVILGFTKPTFNSKATTAKDNSSTTGTCTTDIASGSSCNRSSTSDNTFNNGKLEPSVVGGTQCDIPTLSDGSTTGQVALAGGATCDEAEADIQSANGKAGGGYTANGYTCTSTKQGSGTQWSDYWNNAFYSYQCASGSKQVAFNLQTQAQYKSTFTTN